MTAFILPGASAPFFSTSVLKNYEGRLPYLCTRPLPPLSISASTSASVM